LGVSVEGVMAEEFFGGPEGGQVLDEGGVFDHGDDAGADGAGHGAVADDDIELALFLFDLGDELAEFGGAADMGVAPGIIEGDVAPEVGGVDV